jgi:hypothetical protein
MRSKSAFARELLSCHLVAGCGSVRNEMAMAESKRGQTNAIWPFTALSGKTSKARLSLILTCITNARISTAATRATWRFLVTPSTESITQRRLIAFMSIRLTAFAGMGVDIVGSVIGFGVAYLAPPSIGISVRMTATISAMKRKTQKPRPIPTPKLGPMVKQSRLTRMISKIMRFMFYPGISEPGAPAPSAPPGGWRAPASSAWKNCLALARIPSASDFLPLPSLSGVM